MQKEQRPVICRACHAQCGLLVDFEGGVPVATHGDKDNPVYHGYSCIKGRELARYHSLPSRLRTSLKRSVDGAYQPIASVRAIEEIAERTKAIVAAHGPRSVALYIGTFGYNNFANQGFALAFMDAIGSPMVFTSVTIDQPGKGVASVLHGTWLAGCATIDEWDALLLVGTNPIVSMNGGLGMNPARGLKVAQERGMKLIVIDPRKTDCAAKADLHLQVRPGEDPSVLAAIARKLIVDGAIDTSFIEAETAGFEALKAALEPFTPSYAAERAGVTADEIVRAARLYGAAKRGAVSAGTGPNMSGHGNVTEYLVRVLMSLKGHWLRAGDEKPNPGVLIKPMPALAAAAGPGRSHGFGERLRVRGLTDTAAGLPTAALSDEILLPGEGQVKALFVLGGNPMLAWPDQLKAHEAMKALDLLVCLDPRHSETGKIAHYVVAPKLPYEVEGNTALNEFLGNFGPGWGFTKPYAQGSEPILSVPPGSDLIEEWELFYGVAQKLNLPLRLKTYALIDPAEAKRQGTDVDMARKPTPSEVWDMILKGSPVPLAEVRKHPKGHVFDRPRTVIAPRPEGWAGRLDVGSPLMLAELAEVVREGPEAARTGNEFPYRMISRRLNDMHNSNWHENTAQQRKWAYNPAFLHPDDLTKLGLVAGDVIEVTSARATIFAVAERAEDVRPGCVALSHAWGRNPGTEEDPYRDGGNTGRLSYNDRDYDPITGIPRMSTIPVRLRKAGQGRRAAE